MSKPSEFKCYELVRGQTRGASGGLFGGGKKDQSTGETDTTTKMGMFKALITVSLKSEEEQKKLLIQSKLIRIRVLIEKIYTKNNPNKRCPIQEGIFCENTLEASKAMNEEQRNRCDSDEIKVPDSFGDRLKSQSGLLTGKTNKSTVFDFSGKSSSIMSQEGRSEFKKLMVQLRLTHL